MRLDLFLRATRLVLRRSTAQELCDVGAVEVNGRAAKAAREVKVGDRIDLRYRERLLSVRVVALPAGRQTSRHEASTLYETISETRLSSEP